MPMVAEKLLAFGIHGLRGELHVSWEEGTGVRRRAELLYEQLDGLQGLRRTLRPELLAESWKQCRRCCNPAGEPVLTVGIFYFALSSSMSSNVTLERESVQTKRNWPEESTALPW